MAMQKKFPCIQNGFVDGTQRGAWYEAETERQGVFPEVDSYSTAVLLLSGGTTGVPKLIPEPIQTICTMQECQQSAVSWMKAVFILRRFR